MYVYGARRVFSYSTISVCHISFMEPRLHKIHLIGGSNGKSSINLLNLSYSTIICFVHRNVQINSELYTPLMFFNISKCLISISNLNIFSKSSTQKKIKKAVVIISNKNYLEK